MIVIKKILHKSRLLSRFMIEYVKNERNESMRLIMEFKDKCLYVRAQLNLTQDELVKKLNVSYPSISRWEMGKVKPTRKVLLIFENFCKENDIKFDMELDND